MPVIPEVSLVAPTHELLMQRQQTYVFIAADPSIIALTPRRRFKQPSGSYVWEDLPPRPEQTFKMIPMAAGTKPTAILNGVERIADYTLLGMHDAVVDVHDWFMIGGIKYTVIEMADGHGYETKALVEAHG
jgi:hypothetical protein